MPIVVLITFLIGCIISQQGMFHFRQFGADIFVVDMLGVLVLREIGVLLVAIMVAGRSGSAYTAELGSMKMREEIDALRTMGFDPIEVLILPRMLALVIGLPILAFLGAMAALVGGGLVAWVYGGIDPEAFLSRLRDAISINHFTVGMIKAPVMAAVIGIVACVEGLAVEGSAEVARPAHHLLGGEGNLLRHRHGWRIRDLLRFDRNVTMAAEHVRRHHPGPRSLGAVRRPPGSRWARSRREARRNPGLRRRIRRRQVGADAHHHRPGAQGQRKHRGVRRSISMPPMSRSAAGSSGAGASCSSRARCFPR